MAIGFRKPSKLLKPPSEMPHQNMKILSTLSYGAMHLFIKSVKYICRGFHCKIQTLNLKVL